MNPSKTSREIENKLLESLFDQKMFMIFEGDQKRQTSSYKINSHGDAVVAIVNAILHIRKLLRVDPKSCNHKKKKKKELCMVTDVTQTNYRDYFIIYMHIKSISYT